MIINIRDNENNTKYVKISGKEKIKDLKIKVSNDCEDFDLYFNGKLLNSEKLITDYEINSHSTIEAKNNLKGGLKTVKFADISKEVQTKKLECYNKKNKCPWRIVRLGLNLEGKCFNEKCVAYKKTVIINKEFGRFDLIKQENEILCPMCNEIIEAQTCGFSGCSYCWSGKNSAKMEKLKMWASLETGSRLKKKFMNDLIQKTHSSLIGSRLLFILNNCCKM